jgi:DNA polymerase-3 subunit delta
MQLYPEQFLKQNQDLHSYYLVFGDEPQQKMEVMDAIRHRAKHKGFDERHRFVADAQFDWQQLIETGLSMSLFSQSKLIELELPTGKPSKIGSQKLNEFFERADANILLVLNGPKITQDIQRAKWFKTFEQQGVYVPCFPLNGSQLKRWVQHKAMKLNLQLSPDALRLVCDFCEGNLLAARQELDMLALLYPQQHIELTQLQSVSTEQSRFNVFELIDALLLGDSKRCIKILERLESEGLEPNIILWGLIREWQTLSQLKAIQLQGESINWMLFRIWKNRQSIYLKALDRLNEVQLYQIGNQLKQMDSALKSGQVIRPYVELAQLCLLFQSLPTRIPLSIAS